MSSMPVYTPSWGTICFGCRVETVSSPTLVWLRWVLSHSTRKAAPPWMGTVRSIMSFSCSKGCLSSSLRSISSMILARHSSCFRRGVTLGWGMLLSVCASISSAQMLRTWGVSRFRSPWTMGSICILPLYRVSRSSIRLSSAS